MISRFEQSWQLFKASIRVTFRYRKLLWFPLLTTLFTVVIGLFFLSSMALPVIFHDTGYSIFNSEHWAALFHNFPSSSGHANYSSVSIGLSWLGVLLAYLVSMFLATFFNVAYYSEIIAAFNGRGVSLRRGFQTARNRLPSIIAWSLLAGVVGWGIRAIEERVPLGGRIVAGVIGMAWSVAAVFAIPVIIQEEPTRNPIHILRQSAATLRRTWGEGLIGYVGFSAASMVMFFLSLLLLLVLGGVAFAFKSVASRHYGWGDLAHGRVCDGLRLRRGQQCLSLCLVSLCQRRRGARRL